MRGKPISVAFICADILSKTLERCSKKYTWFLTKHWKEVPGELWMKMINQIPGRLNDLRHIIYKSADTLRLKKYGLNAERRFIKRKYRW